MTETDSDLSSTSLEPNTVTEFEALSATMRALLPLTKDARFRVLSAASTMLNLPSPVGASSPLSSGGGSRESSHVSPTTRFGENRAPSPKDFLFEKRPATDVDRIACLAYYLTHYRETPYFKTIDLSTLNSEAAQLKLSNAAQATDNATRAGLLVQASKGAKQLSALGERYVQALPDRVAAKEAIADVKPRRKARRNASGGESESDTGGAD